MFKHCWSGDISPFNNLRVHACSHQAINWTRESGVLLLVSVNQSDNAISAQYWNRLLESANRLSIIFSVQLSQ